MDANNYKTLREYFREKARRERAAKVRHAPKARFDRWAQVSFLAWAGVL